MRVGRYRRLVGSAFKGRWRSHTERPDLDESVVLDALQDHYVTTRVPNGKQRRDLVQARCICNDRQVRQKHVFHHIDAEDPRVEIEIRSIASTEDMFQGAVVDEPLPF